ncbi:hypothetical protein, partial [Salmonella enterica]|uniref:hypothetical protein n=1 Tax=Salmonella enterica TaxID=28901 RepID=UPI00398C3A64
PMGCESGATKHQPASSNILLMLDNVSLNITLLIQAELLNSHNEVQGIDRGTLPNALCLPGDMIMTMLSFLL